MTSLRNALWRKRRSKPGYKCSDIKVLVPATTPGCFAVKEIIPIASSKVYQKKKNPPKLKLVDTGREGEKYNTWRRAILSREGYKCVLCESTVRIEAHHIIQWVDDERLRFNVRNGVSICFDCHDENHNHNKEKFPVKITNLLKQYIQYRYDRARLVKVPRETETDYNASQAVNSRTNKNVPG